MIVLEAVPWLLSIVMLGAMAALARSAFRAGEFAGRPDIEPPAPPANGADGSAAEE